jgi:hypothetical protein
VEPRLALCTEEAAAEIESRRTARRREQLGVYPVVRRRGFVCVWRERMAPLQAPIGQPLNSPVPSLLGQISFKAL